MIVAQIAIKVNIANVVHSIDLELDQSLVLALEQALELELELDQHNIILDLVLQIHL